MKQWIRFDEMTGPFEPRLKNWVVRRNKKSEDNIGEVFWHAKWKRYIYLDYGVYELHSECMTEIAEFLDKQTKKQVKRDKKVKVARGEEG